MTPNPTQAAQGRPPAAIASVRFSRYKALRDFSLGLTEMNVLVGPNNAGKSTVLGAFRLLSAAIRRARARRPTLLTGPEGAVRPGYVVGAVGDPELAVSLENVHTDLEDTDSIVLFQLTNGNALRLYFPVDGGCLLFCEGAGRPPAGPADFAAQYPVTVGHIPVLGPLEYREPLVRPETVREALGTPRASRHFRNFWLQNPDGFDAFAALVAGTWPGMEVQPPEPSYADRTASMFCLEARQTREVYWAGFGFQVWCQLLTHLLRARNDTLIVVDEPEIYLHPDLQRQLVHVLRSAGPDVVMATHSTEILNEAEPGDLLLVDKRRRSAQRLRAGADVQGALDALGSNHNVQLAQLARNRRVLFVEGQDFALLRRFARCAGYSELANGTGLTVVPIQGFTGWERLESVAWGLTHVLGDSADLDLGVVLDRDFRPDDEIAAIHRELERHLELVHVHARKEIENYLLVPAALDRAIAAGVRDRARRTGAAEAVAPSAADLLEEVTEPAREELRGQYIARAVDAARRAGSRLDHATITIAASRHFEAQWRELDTRVAVVAGKATLAALAARVQVLTRVSLTEARIVDAMRTGDLALDLADLLARLDGFRRRTPGRSSPAASDGG